MLVAVCWLLPLLTLTTAARVNKVCDCDCLELVARAQREFPGGCGNAGIAFIRYIEQPKCLRGLNSIYQHQVKNSLLVNGDYQLVIGGGIVRNVICEFYHEPHPDGRNNYGVKCDNDYSSDCSTTGITSNMCKDLLALDAFGLEASELLSTVNKIIVLPTPQTDLSPQQLPQTNLRPLNFLPQTDLSSYPPQQLPQTNLRPPNYLPQTDLRPLNFLPQTDLSSYPPQQLPQTNRPINYLPQTELLTRPPYNFAQPNVLAYPPQRLPQTDVLPLPAPHYVSQPTFLTNPPHQHVPQPDFIPHPRYPIGQANILAPMNDFLPNKPDPEPDIARPIHQLTRPHPNYV